MWLAAALPVWLIVLATFLWLRRQDPTARVGLATALTLSRGLLLGALAGCLPSPARGWVAWAPGALYTTAAIADLFDGYLARRRDEVTALGSRLDVAMDALGLLLAPLAGVVLGRLPLWYLLLGATYYLFHAALWLRRRFGLPLHEDRLRPDPRARMYAGYQMGLVATALFPVLGPPGTTIAATLFMVPTLALFTREWLLVTGRWQPETGASTFRTARALLGVGLPVLRALAAAGILALVIAGRTTPLVLLGAALLAAGVVTRLTAFATAAVLTLSLGDGAVLPLATYLTTLLLLLAGGGRAVLWNPEDRWLVMRAGTPRRAAA
jgi:CDP-diacylglycerol--glycerol-3-phosphate 3-phosphatidyltransferase